MTDDLHDVTPAISKYLGKLLSSYPYGYELDGRHLAGEWVAKPDALLSIFLWDAQERSAKKSFEFTNRVEIFGKRLVPGSVGAANANHVTVDTYAIRNRFEICG